MVGPVVALLLAIQKVLGLMSIIKKGKKALIFCLKIFDKLVSGVLVLTQHLNEKYLGVLSCLWNRP
jgi:hypothetical protein